MKLDPRYSPDWPKRSRQCRRLTHNRCAICLWRRATLTHHARYYCRVRRSLSGREVPGWDIFPVCDRCHGWAHREINWISKSRRKLYHRQRLAAWARLVIGFQVRRVHWERLAIALGMAALIWGAL